MFALFTATMPTAIEHHSLSAPLVLKIAQYGVREYGDAFIGVRKQSALARCANYLTKSSTENGASLQDRNQPGAVKLND
jgi:hypothetical protein